MDDLTIVGVQKEVDGRTKAYKLSDGQIVSVDRAVSMANTGQLPGYIVSTSATCEAYLRTRPDRSRRNNLSKLPEF